MRSYRFRVVPGDGARDEKLSFHDDDAALASAKAILTHLAADAARKGAHVPEAIEVIRDDDTIVGLVVSGD
jgi:hypothetical protein